MSIRRLIEAAKAKGRPVKEIGLVIYGMLVNHFTGRTPRFAHEALIHQFIRSGGRLNDRISRVLAVLNPPYSIREPHALVHLQHDESFEKIQAQLEVDGYYLFRDRLPEAFCDKIMERIAELNYVVRDDRVPYDPSKLHRYDRNNPIAPNYVLPKDETTDVPEVQELISDPVLIQVAQNYLNSKSIFTGLTLDWSAAVKSVPDMEAAQAFHWDMERIKWLRFFIYLTDVDADSGPHTFIKGSHRTGGLPKEIYSQGYKRHDDGYIVNMFGKDAYREFVGKKGTILAEDSRGLHKGKMLKKGERLLLAFELSNSTFGANKRHTIRNLHSPRFAKFAKQYPGLYSNFDF